MHAQVRTWARACYVCMHMHLPAHINARLASMYVSYVSAARPPPTRHPHPPIYLPARCMRVHVQCRHVCMHVCVNAHLTMRAVGERGKEGEAEAGRP